MNAVDLGEIIRFHAYRAYWFGFCAGAFITALAAGIFVMLHVPAAAAYPPTPAPQADESVSFALPAGPREYRVCVTEGTIIPAAEKCR